MYLYIYIYIYICVYICIYVYMYIYIHERVLVLMLSFLTSFRQNQILFMFPNSSNPFIGYLHKYSLQNLIAFKTQVSTTCQCGNYLIHFLTLWIYTLFKIYSINLFFSLFPSFISITYTKQCKKYIYKYIISE